MAGVALVLDLFRRNHGLYSAQCLQSNGLFSATAAASAAAASIAAGTPFASRTLFGIGVAHCDAGAELSGDFFSNLRTASERIFQQESLEYSRKEYNLQLKPLFSAFEWKAFAMTTLRSFLMFYLPLLEPRSNLEEDDDDDDDFLHDGLNEQHVNLVVPFKKSVKQIIRETTVVTTRRILERIPVHYVSQRMAWKLLKDVPKSAARKAGRAMPTYIYFFSVSRTTFRGHFLGVGASWLVQVGIEIYRYISTKFNSKEECDLNDERERIKSLGKKVGATTVRCTASLVFASIGAGIGATLVRPSIGQWIGCAIGDLAGPIIVGVVVDKAFHVDFNF